MKKLLLLVVFLSVVTIGFSKEPVYKSGKKKTKQIRLREDCEQGTAQVQQSINNVRATLLNSGDVWWNLSEGQYFVPNTPPGIPDVSSIFAASVWIGGYDFDGNLKIAANTYRNTGNTDFFPGPLNDFNGTTDKTICANWNRFFTVYGSEIDRHISNFKTNPDYILDSVPDNVRYWPGKGNVEFEIKYGFPLPDNSQGLGSYHDEDQNGKYEPLKGDYPKIEIKGCEAPQYPDEMIFWIYNDAGGKHTETKGNAIQMEVQVQAFGYQFNNEINDMTFQRYKLINRAQKTIKDCYFALWVDADLGCAYDDYIGCDVSRSLMYTYNEDAIDGEAAGSCECSGTNSYCTEVPILGVDYFRGPQRPVNIDTVQDVNGQDSLVFKDIYDDSIDPDTFLELGMSSFTYYNNGSIGDPLAGTRDPASANEYYNYLDGKWRDGTPFTYGGSGYSTSSSDSTRYAFTDDPNSDNGWSMCTANLPFGDRRTVQASGPFLLTQGAVNELIIGVVWVPDQEYPCPDLSALRKADDLAQALFDNCFVTLDGPNAPDVEYVQLDREVLLFLTNDTIISNNPNETYTEKDIYAIDTLAKQVEEEELFYKFEGYQIYQLSSPNVSDLNDISQARIVRTVDVKNEVTKLYNWTGTINPQEGNNEIVYAAELSSEGTDSGIQHSFRITEDAFADGDKLLINHKEYYYLVIAYGYNEYAPFQANTGFGQRSPYISGRKNRRVITVVPRPMVYDNLNSYYGDTPKITRIQGVGNQGQLFEMENDMYEKILASGEEKQVVYKTGAAPIRVKIVNPLGVKEGDFRLELNGSFDKKSGDLEAEGATWTLTDLSDNKVYRNFKSLAELDEVFIKDYGISVSLAVEPGIDNSAVKNKGKFVGASIKYADPNKGQWLQFIPSGGGSGINVPFLNFLDTDRAGTLDPTGKLRNTDGFNMMPLKLAANRLDFSITPGCVRASGIGVQMADRMEMKRLPNVDIVYTSNKDNWSKCIVLDRFTQPYADAQIFGSNVEREFVVRNQASVGKNAGADGKPASLEDGTIGFAYFPGYAIDVETGKRLNIFFSENSAYGGEIMNKYLDDDDVGRDMMFRPSAQGLLEGEELGPGFSVLNLPLGGQHFVYVSATPYDECALLHQQFSEGSPKSALFKAARGLTWAGLAMGIQINPMLSYDKGLIPNDVTISLRVDNTFGYAEQFDAEKGLFSLSEENPIYEFTTKGQAPTAVTGENISEALKEVSVVPNPYYAHSGYEVTQNDSRVKITNVPRNSTISIYSIDGRFIAQFKRNANPTKSGAANGAINFVQEGPDVVWNVKNSKDIPVASGIYLIHVVDNDTGKQRTVKWFGINRKFDPSGL